MKEIFRMWKYPKMVVLSIVSAGLYALVLIPFKGFQLVPGIAEIRPAAVLPPLLGILFGPAGAWGCAIGNTLGDYFGKTLTMGSYFGALGNFCFAMVAYVLWRRQGPLGESEEFHLTNPGHILRYVSVCMVSCSCVAFVIAWGLEFLGLSAFSTIGSIILVNNLAATLLLGPFLLKLFYSRSKAWGLLWWNIMPSTCAPQGSSRIWSRRLLWTGAVGGLIVGLFLSHFFYQNPFLEAEVVGTSDPAVLMVTAPFLILFFLGCLLA